MKLTSKLITVTFNYNFYLGTYRKLTPLFTVIGAVLGAMDINASSPSPFNLFHNHFPILILVV